MVGNVTPGYATLEEVNAALSGETIIAVQQSGHNSITFEFTGGASMTIASSGLEGDDLDLHIEIT